MLYIIFNPNAGRGRAARFEHAVRHALSSAGLAFELVRTTHVGHAQRLAADAAAADRFRAVVAAGGDGTINEVVNGLHGSSMPMGIIPLGTGNDFVKLLDLPPDKPEIAARRLRDGSIRRVDVGVANGRVFINGLGCGFDAQVTVESRRPTRLRGFAVYLAALIRALGHYDSPRMKITYDGQQVHQRMLLASVGNGRCHGGGFWLTPDADIDDGQLDLCFCTYLSLPQILLHVPQVLRGTHRSMRQVTMDRVRRVTIETSAPVPVHLDGELLGTALTELEIEIRPASFRLLA